MLPLAEGNAIHVYIPSRHLHREQGDPRKILFPFLRGDEWWFTQSKMSQHADNLD